LLLGAQPDAVEAVAAPRGADEERPAVRAALAALVLPALVRRSEHRPDAPRPRGFLPLAGLVADHPVETLGDERVQGVGGLDEDGRAVAELDEALGFVLAHDDVRRQMVEETAPRAGLD